MLCHAFILFGVLTLLFQQLILPIETDTIRGIIKDEIHSIVDTIYRTHGPEVSLILNDYVLERLKQKAQTPEPSAQINNSYLTREMTMVLILIFVTIAVALGVLYLACKTVVPLGWILLENLIMFLIVGAFEYFFFIRIISKYVPIKASEISRAALNILKQELRPEISTINVNGSGGG